MGGEPYTWRRVSTVRRQAVGNLPPKGGTAPTAEPTRNPEEAVRGHGQVRRGNPRFETYPLIPKQSLSCAVHSSSYSTSTVTR